MRVEISTGNKSLTHLRMANLYKWDVSLSTYTCPAYTTCFCWHTWNQFLEWGTMRQTDSSRVVCMLIHCSFPHLHFKWSAGYTEHWCILAQWEFRHGLTFLTQLLIRWVDRHTHLLSPESGLIWSFWGSTIVTVHTGQASVLFQEWWGCSPDWHSLVLWEWYHWSVHYAGTTPIWRLQTVLHSHRHTSTASRESHAHPPTITVIHTHTSMQLFAVAYHQSRWNYNDEPDVEKYVNVTTLTLTYVSLCQRWQEVWWQWYTIWCAVAGYRAHWWQEVPHVGQLPIPQS